MAEFMNPAELKAHVLAEKIEATRQQKGFCVIEVDSPFYAETQEELWDMGVNVIFTGKPGKYVVVW